MSVFKITTTGAPQTSISLTDLGIRAAIVHPTSNYSLTDLGITAEEIKNSSQLASAVADGSLELYIDDVQVFDTNSTVPDFVGATGLVDGVRGLVPAPLIADVNKFLKGDGTWSSSGIGEVNTASNVGSGGVGVFKQKTGVNFEFKNINAGSSKVTVTNDIANNEIDVDVSVSQLETELTLGNISGTLPVSKGGTNSSAALNNNRIMQSTGGAIVEAPAILGSRALKSDASGIPVHFDEVTEPSLVELSYVKGVTSSIQTQLNAKIESSEKGAANGVATLDAGGKVPAAQLPSYVDDALEYADLASFPVTGETGKIYVAIDTGRVYRWTGSIYAEISTSNAGTVTTVSVDTANGFAGSVSNPTTTPAISITTTVTGMLKGNGSSISAATDGTDYVSPTTLATELATYVEGPASATDNAVPRYDSTSGKLIKNSGVTISDANKLSVDSLGLTATGTAPASPTDGHLYYDSTLKCLMAYDSSRSKWLSVQVHEIWADRNGNAGVGTSLRTGSGIPTSTNPVELEQNMTLVGIVASTSNTEAFTLNVDDVSSGGSGTTLPISYPSGTTHQDLTLNTDYNASDALDIYVAASTTGNVSNPRVKLLFRYRK